MPQFLTDILERLRGARSRLSASSAESLQADLIRFIPWIVGVLLFVLVIYYPIGMVIYARVDDDVDLKPPSAYAPQGGSAAVAMTAAVVSREANEWIANKPFWHPAAALDNGPNFQLGIIYAASRFTIELGDYLGRARGSSAIDDNLDKAVGLLKYDGRIWTWGQGNIIPMTKAETNYKQAVEYLVAYNREVAAGKATYSPRADNLIAFLDRVISDLGSTRATIDSAASVAGGYFDFEADDVFYSAKGKLYGYYVIMNALGDDIRPVIKEKQADVLWANLMTSLRQGASFEPLIIVNGKRDSLMMPSHLTTLGFELASARIQMTELRDTLQK